MIIDLSEVHKHISPHFLPLLYDDNRNIVMRGSAGSGKSHFCGQKQLIRILTDWNTTQHRILVLRKTLPSAKDSVLRLFTKYIYDWQIDKYVKSIISNPTSITFHNGSEILIRGLDAPEKIKSIEGITSMWLEEANQFSQEDFDELNRRMRGDVGTYKQMLISFNPVSKYNWLYQHFYNKEVPNTTLHHSTFKDNPYIVNDLEYVEILEQYKDSPNNYNYLVYYEGEWGAKEGLIYTEWMSADEFPVCDTVCYGIDFGFDAPTAVVKVGKVVGVNDIYIELLLYKNHLTNNDLIAWCNDNLQSKVFIYADSAEPDRIVDAKRKGLNMFPAKKGPGSLNAGIDYLQSHRLVLVKNALFEKLEMEITSYTYDESRDGRSLEKPNTKSPDHALDAARYGIWSHFARKPNYFISKV